MKAQGETENNVREHRSPLEYVWGSPRIWETGGKPPEYFMKGERWPALWVRDITLLYPGVWVGEV